MLMKFYFLMENILACCASLYCYYYGIWYAMFYLLIPFYPLFVHDFTVDHAIYAFLCVVVLLGRFFEVLIGTRPEPLWKLLSKIGVLYALEPLLTIIFVINMNIVWEKIMSTLRAQIFGRILIQKVKLNLSNCPEHFYFPFLFIIIISV